MTIQEALHHAITQLREQSESAQFDAEVLLAKAINNTRTYLRTWPEKPLSETEEKEFASLLQRRIKGEPVAYLLGKREFWDLSLTVTPDTLIPRPETEHLVEMALDKIPHDADWKIADLGTGSGAIALALGKHRPSCHVIATDVSPSALQVAKLNAHDLDINNVEFRQGSWFDCLQPHEQFHLIASNPPYVAESDPHLEQGDLRFEPTRALSSGPEGLDDLSNIIQLSYQHLYSNGWILLEHGYNQGNAVTKLLRQRGFKQVACHADYAKQERISCGQWKAE